ncbi:hypothetical protein [Nitrosomonas aestuarii]|uniref:hypothetical protein n=1 Tax=Nitrosomonas aestuarii TaxID=52441 RepID=UPI001BAAEFAC|nr:hypothetical protein [Nitrosomonas aestuarii]
MTDWLWPKAKWSVNLYTLVCKACWPVRQQAGVPACRAAAIFPANQANLLWITPNLLAVTRFDVPISFLFIL